MPSTVIRRFDYRPDRRELEVTFTTGRRYLYSDVSEHAVDEFRAAFSKGVHFNRYIRDRYPCRELHEAK
jgi:lysyl-tRNA synthetase class 2